MSTELQTQYQGLMANPGDTVALLEENLGGEQLEVFDLDQVKVPGGGALQWTLMDELGGEVQKDSVEGVIVFHHLVRNYWEQSIDEGGGGSPPDCTGLPGHWIGKESNTLFGEGRPGGDCELCPHAAFGGDCTQKRFLFMLAPDTLLPFLLRVPQSSLSNVKTYILRLTGKGIPLTSVVSSFGLEKAKSANGITYSRIKPNAANRLSPELSESALTFAQQIRPFLQMTARKVAADIEVEADVGI